MNSFIDGTFSCNDLLPPRRRTCRDTLVTVVTTEDDDDEDGGILTESNGMELRELYRLEQHQCTATTTVLILVMAVVRMEL